MTQIAKKWKVRKDRIREDYFTKYELIFLARGKGATTEKTQKILGKKIGRKLFPRGANCF